MAFVFMTPNLGMPAITAISTLDAASRLPWKLGDIQRAVDPTLGVGEFIFLKGVVGTLAGLGVTYVASTGVTALLSTSGLTTGGAPIAVAMAATVAATYGWYQIAGSTTVLKTAVKVDPAGTTKVYLSATAGRFMQTSVAGRQVIGARWDTTTTVTSTTSTAIVTLNRPSQKDGTLV